MLKVLRLFFVFIFVVLLMVAGIFGFVVYQDFHYKTPQGVTVRVPKGTSLYKIANILKDNNLVRHGKVFAYYVRFFKKGTTLKAGEYEFAAQMGVDDIIAQMAEGRVKQYKITIPEGLSAREQCLLFIKKNLMSAEECQQAILQTSLLKDPEGAVSLEGYLFPETYTYEYDTPKESFVPQMVKMFYQKVGNERMQKARAQGFSLQQLVTLASVVEKETGQPEERPLIAGVFLNRLKIGMLLQSDPTVIYGVPNFNGNLTRIDLQRDTPYNTYTRAGLPAGPICNPGLASIDAVLQPAQTEALYFVAKGDGTHYFSKTLEEHNQAVRQYQLQ